MTAKEIFQASYAAVREIRRLEQRRAHYLAMAASVAGLSQTPVTGGEKHSRTETAAIGLAELADQMAVRAAEYLAVVRKAENLVEKLEKPRFREVLTLRYIQGYSWEDVSRLMGYVDPGSVFRVNRWALQAAQKFLNA